MPRVSQAHRDARRRQILDAARRCFVRNGFHATSMQDVFDEAGLSAGAVYSYFDGKAAIVAAIVEEVLAEIEAGFAPLDESAEPPSLADALEAILRAVQRLDEEHGASRVAVQVWSEAVREPLFAERFAEVFGRVRDHLTAVVEAHQRRGSVSDAVPAADLARVLVSIAPGFVLQRALLGEPDAAELAAALRALIPATASSRAADRGA